MKTVISRTKEFIIQNKTLCLTAVIVVILDKFTKLLVSHTFYPGESRNIIGNFFKLTFIENRGIAFGLVSEWSHPLKTPLLLILSLAALVFIGNIYYKAKKTIFIKLSFGLIFGGAFGNIYDRVVYRSVIDFLNFGIGHARWPFFNIADSSITIGVIIIIFILLRKDNL